MDLSRSTFSWIAASAAVIFAACGNDTQTAGTSDVTQSGDAEVSGTPTIRFVSPAEGALLASDAPVTITLAVTAAALDGLTLEAKADGVGILYTGAPQADGSVRIERTDFQPGPQTVSVTLRHNGTVVASASLHFALNQAPSAPGITLAPAAPDTDAELAVAIATPATDPDGAPVTYQYRWFKDGAATTAQTDRVSPAQTTRGETWRVVVRADDGMTQGPPAEASVTIANAPPTCAMATLLPSSATTAQALTCRCNGWQDADADTAVEHCRFLADGQPIGAEDATTCTLPAGSAQRDQHITCELTPDDGHGGLGAPLTSAAVDILNSAPAAPEVALAPASGDTTTSFTCTATAALTDIDGDSVTTTIAWLVDGVVVPGVTTASIVPGNLTVDGHAPVHGAHLACRVIATDGAVDSQPGTSSEVVLANAAPDLDRVMVRPPQGATAHEGDTVTCDVQGGTDPDGDPLTPVVTWLVNGVLVAGETGTTLGSEHFARGDTILCTGGVTDGTATSDILNAKNAVVVVNAPPVVGGVTVGPSEATKTGVLTCNTTGASDPDGDPVSLTYAWTVNGAVVPDANGVTLSAAALAPGDVVACTATPSDGVDTGAAVPSTGGATIINTVPTLGGATLTPDGATVDATLTCTPTGFADADGESPSYTYVWTRNGTPVAGASDATLTQGFAKGDRMRCRVRASDGHATTAEQVSNEVVILNTLPLIGDAVITPGAGSLCDDYTCQAEDVVDADGDDVTVAYRWSRNGAFVDGETGPVFLGALAAGDQLGCELTATDGTLDAAGALVYGAPVTAVAAYADNAPPTLAGVSVTPADAGVGDVVSCVPSGYADDCSAAAYTYVWTRNGAVLPSETGATLATASFDLADQIACKATPTDDAGTGAAKTSSPIALKKGHPSAPTVEVRSPDGPAVAVQCVIVTPERWFDNPTYAYYWSINSGAEVQTATGTLTPGLANDCDIVTCRVLVSDASAALSSQAATLQFPLGDGCEDGNDCTSHVCAPTGGCVQVVEDGTFCDDADPCSPTGVCDQGTCVATGNICYEEPANLEQTVSLVRPALATVADGSYVTGWSDNNSVWVRFTAPDDSRRDEIVTRNTSNTGPNPVSNVAVDPSGNVLAGEWYGTTDLNNGGIGNYATATMNLVAHVIGDDGSAVSDATLSNVSRTSAYGCSSTARVRDTQVRSFRIGDALAVAATGWSMYDICPGNLAGNHPITIVPATGDDVGLAKTFIGGAERVQASIYDVTTSPPNSTTLVGVWVAPDATTIKARLGTWAQSNLTINTTVDVATGAGTVSEVRVAPLASGGFVVAWARNGATAGDIFFRRFDPSGAPMGAEVMVNTKTAGDQRLGGVGAFDDGGVVVVWDDPSDGSGRGVYGRLFAASDAPEGATFQLNLYSTSGDQFGPTVATFPGDGGFVTAWVDNGMKNASGTTAPQIMTRRFFRDGDPDPGVREKPVPYGSANDQVAPDGAASPEDKILVAFESSLFPGKLSEIEGRLFDRQGKPLGFDFTINTTIDGAQRTPAVAAALGRYAVAWESVGQDGDQGGIYLQRFDGTGAPLGNETRVNDTTAGAQQQPAIAMRADGTMLVTWTGKEAAGASTDVFAKAFDRDGTVIMGETVVNAFTTGAQSTSAITVTKGGAFIVAWQSQNQVDQGGYDIFMRKLTLEPSLVWGPELQANSTVAGDQERPTLSISQGAIGYLAVCWESVVGGASDRDVLCQIFREQAGAFPIERTEFVPYAAKTGAQRRPRAVHGTDGKLVVAWETVAGTDHSGTAIQYVRLPAAGPAVQLPRYLATRWQYSDQTHPFVAVLHKDLGRVLIGWQSKGQDGSGEGVVMRAPFPIAH